MGVNVARPSKKCSGTEYGPAAKTTPPPRPSSDSAIEPTDSAASCSEPPPVQRGYLMPLAEDDRDCVDRWRSGAWNGKRLCGAMRETPSWLTSMVFHAMLMVILGSLASSRNHHRQWEPIVIMLASFDAQQQVDLRTPAVLKFENHPPQGEDQRHAPASVGAFQEDLAKIEEDVESFLAENEFFGSDASEDDVKQELIQPVVSPTRQTDHRPKSRSRRSRASSGVSGHPQSRRQDQRGFDGIVERFILFDVGRLRGAPGRKAHNDFHRLGPEAIPALVRGLNKAAGISASCPIGVISAKLDSEMARARDPDLMRYALEHMGRGVDQRAPHFSRIQRLKRKWDHRVGGDYEQIARRRETEAQRQRTRAAQSLLWMAQSLKSAGKYDAAADKLNSILQEHPDSPAASKARRELKALRQEHGYSRFSTVFRRRP